MWRGRLKAIYLGGLQVFKKAEGLLPFTATKSRWAKAAHRRLKSQGNGFGVVSEVGFAGLGNVAGAGFDVVVEDGIEVVRQGLDLIRRPDQRRHVAPVG